MSLINKQTGQSAREIIEEEKKREELKKETEELKKLREEVKSIREDLYLKGGFQTELEEMMKI
ncbi:Uncharacterised protein [Clostridium perfringens]|uniref:Uncharacterized protein n=1 Tax=Clostridium perfringens TaxID=1502 RepID=A0A2X2YC61_CLOPF|nr:Uncharacterised protein [Clostridium perfringens]